ncbi:hypothetical protein DMUE_6433, partial [Dictyocoela muelleri]
NLSLLDVCYWIRESIKSVKPSTYYNCWEKLLGVKDKLLEGDDRNSMIELACITKNELTLDEEIICDENLPSIDVILCDITEQFRVEKLSYHIHKIERMINSEEEDVVLAFISFKHSYLESRSRKRIKDYIID